jgi:NDP-sugar pyrophosphorylase family protein
MDLLDPNVPFDVWDNSWKIYSRTHNVPPQYVGPQAVVENSMVSEGCVVDGYVDFSVLFQSVVIEEGATVRDSIVLPGSVIKKGANIQYAIIGENAVIGSDDPNIPWVKDKMCTHGITLIADKIKIGIATEKLIKTDLKIQELAHLLGYVDQYHFSRRFKQIVGLSPQQYRTSSLLQYPDAKQQFKL